MLATIVLALVLDEAAVTAALDKCKTDLNGKDAAGRAAALGELAKTPGAKISARRHLRGRQGLGELVEGEPGEVQAREVASRPAIMGA